MTEVKTSIKRMTIYYLLFAISIIPCAVIPDIFPLRNLSAIYLLVLSFCLVLYYSHRVSPTGNISIMMKALSWMGLLMILLRGIKYGAVSEVDVLARHTWYLYYVPMLLLPLFLFYISLFISSKEKKLTYIIWHIVLALTIVFIVLVLTNDLHQQAFIFNENFANWDTDYTHGWLFYVVTAWQYIFYIAAVIILLIKCRVTSSKKNAWIILIPFTIGVVLNILLLTGTMPKINGTNIFEFPETLIFTAAIVLECCICLGLIPTNTKYKDLFNSFTITAQITDKKGTPIFSSNSAVPLTQKQFVLESGSRIGEHTILHKMVIPGGYGFWQEDMSELDRLNNELAEAKEGLSQEVELTLLRNELKEKQAKIEQRTMMYDTIAKHTQKQSQTISSLAEQARKSKDLKVKEDNRRRITLLGAYIKRYANLMLMSEEGDVIEVGELGLSFSEVLRYLNYCGIPGEFINNASGTISSNVALVVFETFETLLEDNYSTLKGVFINLSKKEKVICKLSFENLTKGLSEEMITSLKDTGVRYEATSEDEVTYLSLTIPNGREEL
ncbi:MAG: hypothetical protein J5656_00705 [Clostridia bacterium]|nr:hypothetical protein [Clostridia bacterium]